MIYSQWARSNEFLLPDLDHFLAIRNFAGEKERVLRNRRSRKQ